MNFLRIICFVFTFYFRTLSISEKLNSSFYVNVCILGTPDEHLAVTMVTTGIAGSTRKP